MTLKGTVTLEAGRNQCIEVDMEFTDLAAAEALASRLRTESNKREKEGAPAPAAAAPAQTPAPAPAQPSTPLCKFCGTPTLDVRGNKKGEKSPDFKCPKKGCGAAAWLPKNPGGNLWWKQ